MALKKGAILIHQEDQVPGIFHHRLILLLAAAQVGGGAVHLGLQLHRPAGFVVDYRGGGADQGKDEEPLDEELPHVQGMDGAVDFVGGRHHRHRPDAVPGPFDGGVGKGHKFFHLADNAPMPAGNVPGLALLTRQHLGFLDLVDLGEADGGVAAPPGREGVLADEFLFGVIEEDPLVVHHPTVTGAPGADAGAIIAGEGADVDFENQHPVQLARGLGMGLVHALFIDRGGQVHDGHVILALGHDLDGALVDEPPVGRVPGPRHLGSGAEVLADDPGAAGVQDIGLASRGPGKIDAFDGRHSQLGEFVEADFHAVGPGHVLEVLNGGGIDQDPQFPPQKRQAVLDLPGGGFGQDELLLLKVVGDDLLGPLQGNNPQDEGQRQQHNHQDAQTRQQAPETDLPHGHSWAS